MSKSNAIETKKQNQRGVEGRTTMGCDAQANKDWGTTIFASLQEGTTRKLREEGAITH